MRTATKNLVLVLAFPGILFFGVLAVIVSKAVAEDLDLPEILFVPLAGVVTALGGLFVAFYSFRRDRLGSVEVFLALVGSTVLGLSLISLATAGLMRAGGAPALPLLLVGIMFYLWVFYAFLHYRQGRQDEFLQFLVATAEAQAPLAPALLAYLADRPRGPVREGLVILLLMIFPGYYWIWYQRHNFDRKLARIVDLLEQGYSLASALKAVPGVASREVVMLTSVGQSADQVALCLRHSMQQRAYAVWLEVVPRLVYPLALLYFISIVLSFWMTFLYPKMVKIFAEVAGPPLPLPAVTVLLADCWDWLHSSPWLVLAALLTPVALLSVLLANPTVRWYFPGVSRLYRRHIQGQVLRLLGLLLGSGKTVPEALTVLIETGTFPDVVGERLGEVRRRVEQGQLLADGLNAAGMLPGGYSALLNAAERVRNAPWALGQLGERLAEQALAAVRRVSMLVSPATVFSVGLLVGFCVLAMFMPLVELMARLAE